jgi:hypothetical protein
MKMIIGFGDKSFERAIKRFEENTIRKVKQVVAETAEMAVSQMKTLVPVDSGATRDSIHVEYYNEGLSARIVVGSEIGIYVEYGTGIYAEHPTIPGRRDTWVYFKDGRYHFTRGMRASPFFHPSLEVAFQHFRRSLN